MKEPTKNQDYFKNNYYKLKIEPLEFGQCNDFDESDFQRFSNANDSNYLLKLKINSKCYTFLIKADSLSHDQVVIDVDDTVMTVMQLYHQENQSNHSHKNFSGFAHSFAIPNDMKLNEIKLYGKENILLIIIPRL